MKRVLTYGTFDLFHEGHINFLAACRTEAGTEGKVIVGVATDEYRRRYGLEAAAQTHEARCHRVRGLSYPVHADSETGRARVVDIVIKWRNFGQIAHDIRAFKPDVLMLGNDWKGIEEITDIVEDVQAEMYFNVKYVPRTPGISSTMLRRKLRERKITPPFHTAHGVYYFTDS